MLAFNLLRVAFARPMAFRRDMPSIRPPIIGEKARDPKRHQEGFKLQEPLVLTTAKHIRQDLSSPVIDGVPQPTGFFLLLRRAPHLVGRGSLDPRNTDCYVVGPYSIYQGSIHRREGRPFFC